VNIAQNFIHQLASCLCLMFCVMLFSIRSTHMSNDDSDNKVGLYSMTSCTSCLSYLALHTQSTDFCVFSLCNVLICYEIIFSSNYISILNYLLIAIYCKSIKLYHLELFKRNNFKKEFFRLYMHCVL